MCVCSLAYCNAWLQLVAATGKEGGKKIEGFACRGKYSIEMVCN